jgi:hypothetical protein
LMPLIHALLGLPFAFPGRHPSRPPSGNAPPLPTSARCCERRLLGY